MFRRYLDTLKDGSNLHDIDQVYNVYQTKRNDKNKNLLETYHVSYKCTIDSKDDKRLWRMIDWSGNKNIPSVFQLSGHFTKLYKPIDQEEKLYL